MKIFRKALIGGTIGFFSVKKLQALKKQQSLRSLLIEEVLATFVSNSFELIISESEKSNDLDANSYELPKEINLLYGFKKFDHFDDTFEYVPTNGVQDKVIFYIHGGAYWSQPLLVHYRMTSIIAKYSRARVIFPVYPKAPVYTAQDMYNMVIERYLYLINEKGINPANVIFSGDSAGGGFVIGLLNRLKEHNYPLPSKVIALSPWLEITASNKQIPALEKVDPLLDRRVGELGKVFAGKMYLKDPLISPVYGDYAGLPHIYIFTGTHDILVADIEDFMLKADEKGWNITLYKYPNMIHVFPALPIPEASEALQKIASIISE